MKFTFCYLEVLTIKIKTKLKIKKLKYDLRDKYYKFMQWLFKPLIKLSEHIDDKKYEKKCDPNTYNIDKLKKTLYKGIQNLLLSEDVLFIFDSTVGFIPEDSGWNDMTVWDLFKKSKNKLLSNYVYYVKPKTIPHDDWFDIIKDFNGNDIKVEEVDKDEAFKYTKYKEYDSLYRKSNRILRITKY